MKKLTYCTITKITFLLALFFLTFGDCAPLQHSNKTYEFLPQETRFNFNAQYNSFILFAFVFQDPLNHFVSHLRGLQAQIREPHYRYLAYCNSAAESSHKVCDNPLAIFFVTLGLTWKSTLNFFP